MTSRPWRTPAILAAFGALIVVACVFACGTSAEREQFDEPLPTLPAPIEAGAPEASVCPSNTCLPYHLDCNGDAGDGCEANIRSSIWNCGACGHACVVDADGGEGGVFFPPFTRPTCIEGACVFECVDDPQYGPMRNCAGGDPMIGDAIRGCPNQILCDPLNCGACGVVVPKDPTGDRICAGGNPLSACPSGTLNCGGACGQQCKDVNHDAQNCGACGRTCPDPSIPFATVAALAAKNIVFSCNGPNADGGLPPCVPTCKTMVFSPYFAQLYKDCDGDFDKTVADPTNPAYNGCEVDTFNNKSNCGACGNGCVEVCHTKKGSTTAEQVCDCPSGLSWCADPWPGDCVDTNNDPHHCGACNGVCAGPWDGGNGNPTCVDGKCGYKCKAGYADCDNHITETDGCEVDTQNFPAHCGACGHQCLANQRCGNGECLFDNCAPGPTR